MEINVKVVDYEIVNKGRFKYADVTTVQDGKETKKKIMSFGEQENVFKRFQSGTIEKGANYTVEIKKNAENFWDWVKIIPGSHAAEASAPAPSKATPAPARGNYETPEERMARQVYIVRQSSISSAVEYLNHNKPHYDVKEIITLASEFEDFVFSKKVVEVRERNPMVSMTDDIPY